MKLIKKIAAIMLSVMMVLGMASVVSAEEGGAAAATGTGKITINNAISGQTYKIYKLLDLESYNKDNNLYSYKPVAEWKDFFATGGGSAYVNVNENGYVTWKASAGEDAAKKEARAAELAEKALAYATENSSITVAATQNAANTTVVFENLALGYYLVDSSVGTLCGLTTTDDEVTIQEKNSVPSVEKKVSSEENGIYGQSNFAYIGDKVFFQTTITAQPGAQNYVLHDKMDAGLTFTDGSVVVKKGTDIIENTATINYEVKNAGDGCTFHVEFTKAFCDTLAANDQIIITYSATLNGNAFIGMKTDGSGNTNTTHISYGENNTESTPSKTDTYTLQIPVFKYTNKDNQKIPLAGAKFVLYDSATGGNAINLVKKDKVEEYRKALETETAITEITTTNTGEFSIQGLKPGTYWLEETAAPKGYNKLAKRIKIELTGYGNFVVDDAKNGDAFIYVTIAEVENNTGTILPTTGGNGTSLIYFLGAVLALGSGVVLITKKRMR